MKKAIFVIPVMVALLIVNSAFTDRDAVSIPEAIANEYVHSVSNEQLSNRFETQFYDLFSEVNKVDVHQNAQEVFYYVVYGANASGEQVVDYFKTTEAEVVSEQYNYIEMNSRTLGGRKCRETITWPPPTGHFCHPNNPGYICGIEIWPEQCFLY